MVHEKHLEIILNLINKKENFITNISRDINTSHVEVLRKTKELEEKGVIYYKYIGRNKMYKLMENIVAQNMIIMAEMYKTNKIIEKYPKLGIIFDEINKNIKSELIILFGSYAKEIADNKSDIDIFIETKNKNVKNKIKEISRKINLKIGEFKTDNLLVKEIIQNHCIIKGVEKYYGILKKA
jgi:predicted nucleotidyltransferase